jgi:GNAT superfamily N-acetyltransferase
VTPLELRAEHPPDPADVAALDDRINAFNVRVTGIDDWLPLAIFVRDQAGQIVAGVTGGTWAGYLDLKVLWVDEALRGQGYGSRLLEAAEAEALSRGCPLVLLDTHDFQALPFYLARGYEVFGTFDGMAGGHSRFYLRKRLS